MPTDTFEKCPACLLEWSGPPFHICPACGHTMPKDGYAPIVPGPANDDGTGRKSAYDTTWPDVHHENSE